MPKAIIVGCNGQDGTFLFDLLKSKDYILLGIEKTSIRTNSCLWSSTIDISNYNEVCNVIKTFQPDELYYLAAFHHSSEDKIDEDRHIFNESFNVNFHYLVNFLNAISLYSRATKLFYAASSHVFGEPISECQDEQTLINPVCIYGMSKAAGMHVCRYYRNMRSIFASVGILYNHESSLRGSHFISKKIITGAINIRNGIQDILEIGNPQAVVDWGYAPDYVEAMHGILMHEKADDFIIATGIKHTVQEFVEITFNILGIDWEKHIRTNPELLKKKNRILVGNPQKIFHAIGWRAKTEFENMINFIVKDQLNNFYKT